MGHQVVEDDAVMRGIIASSRAALGAGDISGRFH